MYYFEYQEKIVYDHELIHVIEFIFNSPKIFKLPHMKKNEIIEYEIQFFFNSPKFFKITSHEKIKIIEYVIQFFLFTKNFEIFQMERKI